VRKKTRLSRVSPLRVGLLGEKSISVSEFWGHQKGKEGAGSRRKGGEDFPSEQRGEVHFLPIQIEKGRCERSWWLFVGLETIRSREIKKCSIWGEERVVFFRAG